MSEENDNPRIVPMRLQKFLARAGAASRRGSENLMTAGRVTVNGEVVTELGSKVDPLVDEVAVDGRVVRLADGPVTLMLHKPTGYVTTMSDPQGRPTVAELVPAAEHPGLFPIGRLDRDSEGLLLMTNDGALAQAMLHPRGEVDKVYQVTVSGTLERSPERLSAIRMLDGERIRPAKVEILRRWPGQALLEITIHEGKNRQIRRMCRQVGLNVLRLQRVREHTLSLGHLKPGKWRYLTEAEIRTLKRSLHYEP